MEMQYLSLVRLTEAGLFFCGSDIQENENGPNRVCKESQGNQRIKIKAERTNCGIIISNVTKANKGQWLCLVDDGKKFMDK
jgi:hypothetical protein